MNLLKTSCLRFGDETFFTVFAVFKLDEAFVGGWFIWTSFYSYNILGELLLTEIFASS